MKKFWYVILLLLAHDGLLLAEPTPIPEHLTKHKQAYICNWISKDGVRDLKKGWSVTWGMATEWDLTADPITITFVNPVTKQVTMIPHPPEYTCRLVGLTKPKKKTK